MEGGEEVWREGEEVRREGRRCGGRGGGAEGGEEVRREGRKCRGRGGGAEGGEEVRREGRRCGGRGGGAEGGGGGVEEGSCQLLATSISTSNERSVSDLAVPTFASLGATCTCILVVE